MCMKSQKKKKQCLLFVDYGSVKKSAMTSIVKQP